MTTRAKFTKPRSETTMADMKHGDLAVDRNGVLVVCIECTEFKSAYNASGRRIFVLGDRSYYGGHSMLPVRILQAGETVEVTKS